MNTTIKPNILLIGCGPHAKRVYFPALKNTENQFGTEIKAFVELKSKQSETADFVKKFYPNAESLYVEPFSEIHRHTLPSNVEQELNVLVKKHHINGVVISTDPLNHMQYALWAERKGLHVLMDKPISTYCNVSNSIEQARQLKDDFDLLIKNYDKSKAFIVNSQRRFLPQFELIQNQICEVAREYGVPITSMQSTHSDGQWRLPNEVINIDYHGYHGQGKVSHSGYHFIDMASKLTKESFIASGKTFNKLSVFSSFIRPSGVLKTQNQSDLKKIFGEKYSAIDNRTDYEIKKEYHKINEGEVDATSIITLFNDDVPISNLTLNLIHNGFSRRSWMIPNIKDLYKGNGRVRHEYHNIQQGPLQNIQVHSYQSSDKHDINTEDDFMVGGNNHYDILIFRNKGIIGGEQLEIIKGKELADKYSLDKSKVMNEIARHIAVNEFLEVIVGKGKALETKGNIINHDISAQLMSMIYESGIKRTEISQNFKGLKENKNEQQLEY